jgi:hypothetical protein
MLSRTIALGSATLLAAAAATIVAFVPAALGIEEPWNIVVVSQLLGLLRLTFIVALAHAIILGLPLFLALRSRFAVGIVTCALGGFGVGAIGIALLGLLGMFFGGSYNASSGGVPTIVNGVPTLAGLVEYAAGVGEMGLVGLAGGLAFWLAMRLSGQLTSQPSAEASLSEKSPGISRVVAASAIVSTCAALVLPSVVTDNSCHNPFRDGRMSLLPQIHADVNLTTEDWPALAQILTDFGASHALSIRSDQKILNGELMWRSLDLCNEDGISIKIEDWLWLDRMPPPPPDRFKNLGDSVAKDVSDRIKRASDRMKGIKLEVHELRPGSGWSPLTHELLEKIETRWPQKIVFEGSDGKAISEAEALKGRQ